ncbi:asparagine synthase (glutamine-hydrolyzing) [Alphaproteobacteria bacterium]|nr:asparagine synthase (glutamine-hydrolyzing) [Alphaproteobacteria bacterium]
MCGIFGAFGTTLNTDEVKRIQLGLRHRGPDYSGHLNFTDNIHCTLIHTRLSILDLSTAGAQPMVSDNLRYVISYNGEIYNHNALRHYLKKKYNDIVWSSRTDTEVILKGWELEGETFIRKLNGMFAFLILDRKKNELIAIRDPFGIKPLFLSSINKKFYFSSEMKSFHEIKGFTKSINVQSLKSQLTFMFIPEPNTIYNEVSKLTPGFLYKIDVNGISKTNLFADFLNKTNPDMRSYSETEIIKTFRENLFEAISNQMIADVPVGVMLSGGLDSSAIVEGVYQSGNKLSAAFTINTNYENASLDMQSNDYAYAKIMADKYSIPLYSLKVKPNYFENISSLGEFFEDGYSDPAVLATYYLSKLASDNGIKVLLTGQGADEMLYGYRRYEAVKFLRLLPNLEIFSRVQEFLPNIVSGKYSTKYRRLKKFLNVATSSKLERYANLYTWCDQKIIKNIFLDESPTDSYLSLNKKLKEDNGNSIFKNMCCADINLDLRSLNLTYCDRMTMAASLEARVPFLDLKFANFCYNLPDDLKIKFSNTKYILKKSMEGYLPNEIIYREKAGLALPIRSWVSNWLPEMMKYFDPKFLNSQGIFNSEKLNNELYSFKQGNDTNCFFLLSYFVLQNQINRYGLN